jgi:hypothetical protein
MANKLELSRILRAVDQKNYDFFNNLTEDEKKEFSPFVLMRFISNVDGDPDIQEWFIEMTNECVNKNHWLLSKNHRGLLWKLFAATGIGSVMYHSYMAASKKERSDRFVSLLMELHPSAKTEDLEILSIMMTKEDKSLLFDNLGFDKKQRKEYE